MVEQVVRKLKGWCCRRTDNGEEEGGALVRHFSFTVLDRKDKDIIAGCACLPLQR
jgi:hypothetical protein